MFLRCNLRWAVVMAVIAGLPLASAGPATAADAQPAEPATAAEEEQDESTKPRQRNWRMRIIGAVGGDNGGVLVTHGDPYAGVSVSGGGGVGVNFEYRTSPRMGFEIGAMAVGGNVRVGVARSYHHDASGV